MRAQRIKTPSALLPVLLALVATPALTAQSVANPSKAPVPVDDDTITMSVFEVSADQDNGYAAVGTLAGTRLRTDLRDVAASNSIVTKQFMEDIGASNLGDLLVYTAGTEVNGLGGNFSGANAGGTTADFDQGNRSPTSTVRIRNIGSGNIGADQARDYFTTGIPSDSFNIDRVEVNRGPNAMLFGLGSPSGIVNATLIKPKLEKNATSVEAKFGRFGTRRLTLDHNQVLINKKLAMRVALLDGNQKFMQDPAYDSSRRGFIAVTYKPYSGTTIKVNAEMGNRMSNKVQARPPFDAISYWFEVGKPVYDPTTSLLSFLGTAPATTSPIFPGQLGTVNGVPNTWTGGRNSSIIGQVAAGIYVVNENPNVRDLGVTGYKQDGIIGWDFANDRVHPIMINPPSNPGPTTNVLTSDSLANMGNAREILRRKVTGLTGALNSTTWVDTMDPIKLTWDFWKTPQMIDPRVFDFYTQMLEGPNKKEGAKWKTGNITIEQRLGKNAGIELGADIQDMKVAYVNAFNSSSFNLNIDISSKLPDGRVNPNFGRPFISNQGWAESSVQKRKSLRATGYYELDLRKKFTPWLGKLLGKHTATLNVTQASYFSEAFGGRPAYSGLDYYNSENAFAGVNSTPALSISATKDFRAIWRMNYVGPSLLNASSAVDSGIQNVRVDTGFYDYDTIPTRYYQSPANYARNPAMWQNVAFSQLKDRSFWDHQDGTGIYTASRQKNRSLSKVMILNSRLLDDCLITTLGWRQDVFNAFDSGAPTFDPATGSIFTDWTRWDLKSTLSTTVKSFNYGIVGHAPKFIRKHLPLGMDFSLTYNKSDNTAPINPRTSIYGNQIPMPTGSTQEYGGRLSFMDGMFEVRVIKFETSSLYSTNGDLQGPKNNINRAIEQQYRNMANGYSNRVVGEPDAQPFVAPTAAAQAGLDAWNAFFKTKEAQAVLTNFLFTGVGTPAISHDDRVTTVFSTSDIVAKGWDYELIYNPTKNWRISANASMSETIRDNSGAELYDFSEKINTLLEGPAGQLAGDAAINSANPLRDKFVAETVAIRKQRDLDGTFSPEQRKWRFNAVTSYSFSKGMLKGVKIGGAVRWQDKIAIGFPVVNRPKGIVKYNPVYDITRPFYGPAETNYDIWLGYSRRIQKRLNWSIQLNVKNLGQGKFLIPIVAQPDGSIASYRIGEPMTWTLSNKFDF